MGFNNKQKLLNELKKESDSYHTVSQSDVEDIIIRLDGDDVLWGDLFTKLVQENEILFEFDSEANKIKYYIG